MVGVGTGWCRRGGTSPTESLLATTDDETIDPTDVPHTTEVVLATGIAWE